MTNAPNRQVGVIYMLANFGANFGRSTNSTNFFCCAVFYATFFIFAKFILIQPAYDTGKY